MDYYSRYNDSAPRTPSPLEYQPYSSPKVLPSMTHPSIYEEDNTNYIVNPQHQYWHPPSPPQRSSSAGSGSLLSELYDEPPPSVECEWQSQSSQLPPQQQQQPPQRRATFPYVRHDHHSASSSLSPSPDPYVEPEVKIEDVQQYNTYPVYHLAHHHHQQQQHQQQQQYMHHHPHSHLPHHQQQQHHHHHHQQHLPMQLPQMHPAHGMPMLPPTMGISHPVQHTDDAASKETQFLRRRCFNCHTTEPPSWRRSTLNPGKIVCNKCGLYERTHLRPRPLRFDELRAGNKQRKVAGTTSPPTKKQQLVMARAQGARRSSVSSGGASSDWDDNASSSSSVYSSPRVTGSETLPTIPSPMGSSSELPPTPTTATGPCSPPNPGGGLQLQLQLNLQHDGIQLPQNPPMTTARLQMHGRNKSHTFSGGCPPGTGVFGSGSDGYEASSQAEQGMQRRGSVGGL